MFDGTGVSATVTWLPHYDLPWAMGARLEVLFKTKRRWEARALKAYIVPLLEPGATFDSVITRFCRDYRSSDGVTTYTLT